jgi:hypothetical protein
MGADNDLRSPACPDGIIRARHEAAPRGTPAAEAVRPTDPLGDRAAREDAVAQFELGMRHADGVGMNADPFAAVAWYRKAAEQGHSGAMINLGWMLMDGKGAERDAHEALRWITQAANQGDADAQYLLGWLYAGGRGTETDTTQAIYWYGQAAAQNYADSRKQMEHLQGTR